MRKERAGVVEPVIIHCSAGIGRTGVIILLETALCLIEAGQPVYPLEIVRQMRDQRAMMVQTSVSTLSNEYTYTLNLDVDYSFFARRYVLSVCHFTHYVIILKIYYYLSLILKLIYIFFSF